LHVPGWKVVSLASSQKHSLGGFYPFLHHIFLEPHMHEVISTQLFSHTRERKNLFTDQQSSILLALYRTNQPSFVQHFQNGLFPKRRVKLGSGRLGIEDEGTYHLHWKTRTSGWKIKWLAPFRMGTFRKYELGFAGMQFFYSCWSVQLILIYFVVGRSPNHVKCLPRKGSRGGILVARAYCWFSVSRHSKQIKIKIKTVQQIKSRNLRNERR